MVWVTGIRCCCPCRRSRFRIIGQSHNNSLMVETADWNHQSLPASAKYSRFWFPAQDCDVSRFHLCIRVRNSTFKLVFLFVVKNGHLTLT